MKELEINKVVYLVKECPQCDNEPELESYIGDDNEFHYQLKCRVCGFATDPASDIPGAVRSWNFFVGCANSDACLDSLEDKSHQIQINIYP